MDMSEKTVLVTGATSGIGFVAASQLASMGARVILVGRNETKGDLAKKKILGSTPQAVLRFFRADLSYQQDIKILVEQLISSEPKLDMMQFSNLAVSMLTFMMLLIPMSSMLKPMKKG